MYSMELSEPTYSEKLFKARGESAIKIKRFGKAPCALKVVHAGCKLV